MGANKKSMPSVRVCFINRVLGISGCFFPPLMVTHVQGLQVQCYDIIYIYAVQTERSWCLLGAYTRSGCDSCVAFFQARPRLKGVYKMDLKLDLESASEDAYCFLFCDDELLVEEVGGVNKIPQIYAIKILNSKPAHVHYMGSLDDHSYYAGDLCSKSIPQGFSLQKIRQLYGCIEDACYQLLLRAFHIMSWINKNKFCSCCGGLMKLCSEELSVECMECGHLVYPRISPAIIVAVIKDDQILLAHSSKFPSGRYSVIAGFVEPGEALEDSVKRELKEEVGIDVTEIQYFGSQPWPFPDSLMVAFTARWSKEMIAVDNKEIDDANWYSASNLPNIPDKGSIARRLIDWFVERANS